MTLEEKITKRFDATILLSAMVLVVARTFPDLRFHQILYDLGINNNTDQFNEEPIDTLIRIQGNKLLKDCNPLDIIDIENNLKSLLGYEYKEHES